MHAKSLFYIYSIACLCFCTIFTLKFANKIESTDFLNKPIMADKKGLRDTFYISHGSPRLSIDDSLPARHFLKAFQRTTFSEKPKAILIISGHWETSDPTLNAVVGPMETIYDFYGFPEPMYQLKYPAPGAPDLADRVKSLLHDSGFKRVNIDTKRGLDHGAWVPLMLMYPECDIPVCQLSVQTQKDATHHFNLGKALRGLKDDGVLVIGSGAATHNLRTINRNGGTTVAPWAYEFDNWVKVALEEGRYGDVNEYKEKAPHASLAHPSPDHFYPLHVAMGAAGENTRGEVVHQSWSLETLSYASYRFREKDE